MFALCPRTFELKDFLQKETHSGDRKMPHLSCPTSQTRRTLMRRAAGFTLTAVATPYAQLASAADPSWLSERSIKFVVPFPAGGGADIAARMIAQAIGLKLGQPIVVDNKAGAGGAVGSQSVQTARADGYTLLVGSADTHSIYPHVYTRPIFQAQEFTAVAPITRIAYVLMGRPGLPAKNARELVTLASKSKLSYASWGAGSAAHAAMCMFMGAADLTDMLHVPYAGSAPAVQGLMGSQVDLMMVPMPLAVANRSRLTVFGVSALARIEAIKDVPTLAEQGYVVDANFWIGLLGPAKMPAAPVAAISARVMEAVGSSEVQEKLLGLGMVPHLLTQPEFASYVSSEYSRWGQVIRTAGIKIDQ
jgi:tripartite-type tricarboxylate transporter receptor subunit TctC